MSRNSRTAYEPVPDALKELATRVETPQMVSDDRGRMTEVAVDE